MDRGATWILPSRAPLVATADADRSARTPEPDRTAAQRGFQVPLLTGVLTRQALTPEERKHEPPGLGNNYLFNSAMLLDGSGQVLGRADKVELMPFSENFEIGRWVYYATGIDLFNLVVGLGDFSSGTAGQVLNLPRAAGDARIGVMICYEDILPSFARKLHEQAPNILVNLSNDAWFGQTSEPWLHLQLATFRAVEQRVALVRSTNTGVSGYVDPGGRLVNHTRTTEPETLLFEAPLIPATDTLYTMLGDWPANLGLLALVGGWVRRRRVSAG